MIEASPLLAWTLSLLPAQPLVARSVKVGCGGLSPGRFLCSFSRAALAPAAGKAFARLAEAFLLHPVTRLAPFLAEAEGFHLAVDPADATSGEVRKAYVELHGPSPLAYAALKASGGKVRLTTYTRIPADDAERLLAGLPLGKALLASASEFLDILRTEALDVEYLQVAEEGTARRSLDINLSDCVLSPRLKAKAHDLANYLHPGAADQIILPAGLSHLALGASAASAPFLTYYGFPEPVSGLPCA